jgi:hypothetical protein
MAILTFPSIVPEIQEFGITYNTQISTSTIAGQTQTVELPGARWHGSVSYSQMTPSESADLKAFLLQLRGSKGTFFYGDLTHTTPFNDVYGSITIDSASIPSIIRLDLGSGSPAFSAGDYIQIGADDSRELKMVISSTNISGDTYDLVIEPLIRRTDYVGLSVTYADPKGVFMLTSDDQASWGSRSKAQLSDINLDFIEIFT